MRLALCLIAALLFAILTSMYAGASSGMWPVPSGGEYSSPVFYFYDDFIRADSGTLGANWTEIPSLGGVAIQSNSVVGANTSSPNVAVLSVSPDLINGKLTAKANRGQSTQAQPGVVFRYVDADNYSAISFSAWNDEIRYMKCTAGVSEIFGTVSCPLPQTTGKEFSVVFNGSAISVDCGNDSSIDLSSTDPAAPVSGNVGVSLSEGTSSSAMINWFEGENYGY